MERLAGWVDALGMYDAIDRSRARSRRLRRSAVGGERVNARGVRHRLGAQDSEMPAGHQVELGAGDQAGELATVGDGHHAVAPAVQHERRDVHVDETRR